MISEAFQYKSLGHVKVVENVKNDRTGNPIVLVFVGQTEDCFYQEVVEGGCYPSGRRGLRNLLRFLRAERGEAKLGYGTSLHGQRPSRPGGNPGAYKEAKEQ